MTNESIQEGGFFMVVTPIWLKDFLPTNASLVVCEVAEDP